MRHNVTLKYKAKAPYELNIVSLSSFTIRKSASRRVTMCSRIRVLCRYMLAVSQISYMEEEELEYETVDKDG